MRQPNFDNLLRVLDRRRPTRPTLFELYLNHSLYYRLAGLPVVGGSMPWSDLHFYRIAIGAHLRAGYDYVSGLGSEFMFPKDPSRTHIIGAVSRSMNDTAVICDRETFNKYPWPDPDAFDYSALEQIEADLPDSMKLIVFARGGLLENVIELVGYEPLCYLMVDEPALVHDLFDAVGSRLLRYYEICSAYPAVGALIVNDDWGFATQPMLPPESLRQFVFPWHRRIVQAIHKANKPAILHSCGQIESLYDDIIDDLKYDAKHSFEDKILPVEEAYLRWGQRIAILGGIDLDFVSRSRPAQVRERSVNMLELSVDRGGYALGTGNSVPDYVPHENYFAMLSAATDDSYADV
jgi:uroporphyrinogen decarboxylase